MSAMTSYFSTFHRRLDIDRNPTMTLTTHLRQQCSSSGSLYRSNISLWNVSHINKTQFLLLGMAGMVLDDTKLHKYDVQLFHLKAQPQRHCNSEALNKVCHMTTQVNQDRSQHT